MRAATDAEPTATILSVDGIGAYDHVHRAAMLGRLLRMPAARTLLPFVRLSYAQPSHYLWHDEEGVRRTVTQAEGGEQGDPLMPFLFSIGIQGVLEEVATHLEDGEQICAFLDDVYLLCKPARVEPLYKVLEETMMRIAGIRLHQGKTRAWNKAGVVPDDILNVGAEAWQPEGITVLGTPIGSEVYIAEKMEERISKERILWEAIRSVPDLQCAWQILLQSANPRANHTMRTMPPSLSAACCVAHDEGIWSTAKGLLGGIPDEREEEAHALATLPMRMGGLGLRSAARCARSAFWASWADSIQMIHQRTPGVAVAVVRRLCDEGPLDGCLQELRQAATELVRKGFWWQPSWTELRDGKRPPQNDACDSGEWPHGWQYWASSVSDTHYRRISMLTGRPASRRAHLRSHSGHNAGLALSHAPTAPEYTVPPHLFRVLLLERLGLPLPVTEARCSGCHEPLDVQGHHLAACPRTGRLKKRATPTERMLARICREAGARVRYNALLRDMNVHVPANDERRIEVLAQDLPMLRWRSTRGGHHTEERVGMFWRTTTSRRRCGWGRVVSSQEREGDHLSRIGDIRALQARGRGDRDGRKVERGGCPVCVAAGAGQGTRSSPVLDSAGGPRLGTPLDTHAEHSVRVVFCRVIGGTNVARVVVRDRRGPTNNCGRPFFTTFGSVFLCD